jgi:hypothetical protein
MVKKNLLLLHEGTELLKVSLKILAKLFKSAWLCLKSVKATQLAVFLWTNFPSLDLL